jgi:UDP-3-O-[3-hydroxymyristoyl] N-acetylglucosamine deacetylase
MRCQRTIRREIRMEGRGLHGGDPAALTLRPAAPDTGRVFVRADLGGAEVPVRPDSLATVGHATRLESGEARIDTPEHLLAALVALGVDNVRIELDGPEVPIFDGSSLPFVEALRGVGLRDQDALREYLTLSRSLEVGEDGKRITLHPCPELRITYAIDFEHPRLGYQELTCEVFRPLEFALKLAPARTFVLEREVAALKRAGLAKGGSLDNALVVGEGGLIGDPALRFPDEFVRHKMLDLLGDLALLGRPLRAHVVAYRAGHRLHARLVRRLVASPDRWYRSLWTGEVGQEFSFEDLPAAGRRDQVV